MSEDRLESYAVKEMGVELVLDVDCSTRTVEVMVDIERAQSLAVDILAAHPLERSDRETTEDWKADASRYLKDSNMLTRRFARRTLTLCQAVEDALMQLTVAGLVKEALTGAEAAELMRGGPRPRFEAGEMDAEFRASPDPFGFLADFTAVAAKAVQLARASNAGEARFEAELGGYAVELIAKERTKDGEVDAEAETVCRGNDGRRRGNDS